MYPGEGAKPSKAMGRETLQIDQTYISQVTHEITQNSCEML